MSQGRGTRAPLRCQTCAVPDLRRKAPRREKLRHTLPQFGREGSPEGEEGTSRLIGQAGVGRWERVHRVPRESLQDSMCPLPPILAPSMAWRHAWSPKRICRCPMNPTYQPMPLRLPCMGLLFLGDPLHSIYYLGRAALLLNV